MQHEESGRSSPSHRTGDTLDREPPGCSLPQQQQQRKRSRQAPRVKDEGEPSSLPGSLDGEEEGEGVGEGLDADVAASRKRQAARTRACKQEVLAYLHQHAEQLQGELGGLRPQLVALRKQHAELLASKVRLKQQVADVTTPRPAIQEHAGPAGGGGLPGGSGTSLITPEYRLLLMRGHMADQSPRLPDPLPLHSQGSGRDLGLLT